VQPASKCNQHDARFARCCAADEICCPHLCCLYCAFCSLEKRVNKKVMAMFERAEQECKGLEKRRETVLVSLLF